MRRVSQPVLPRLVAIGNRRSKARSLDLDPQMREIVQMVEADWRDREALAAFLQHKTFSRQPGQRLADRPWTDAELNRQVIYFEPLRRAQPTCEDPRPDGRIGALGQADGGNGLKHQMSTGANCVAGII